MSASREKKDRQGVSRGALEQQKQEAYRRKVRLYTAIGVVVVVLVAALLIWNTGIFQRNQTAVTVGETKYTVNDLAYYYQSIRYQNTYIYSMYGMTPPSDDTVVDEETGETYRDQYMESAVENLREMTALYDEAMANGYTEESVADAVQETIDAAKSTASENGYTYDAFLKAQYGRFMTQGAFKSIVTKAQVAQDFYDDYSDGITYDENQVQDYYAENRDYLDTFEYSYLYFTPETVKTTDDEGNDLGLAAEEVEAMEKVALEAAKELADAALAALEGGVEPADVIAEYAPGQSGDHNEDVGTSISSAAYRDKLVTMKDGEFALEENGAAGYYVLALHHRYLLEDPTRDVRHILIRVETGTDEDGNATEPTDQAWEDARSQAASILAEYQAGDQSAEAFGALAEQYSSDTGSNTEGGLYEGASPGDFVSEFDAWLFDDARVPGDVDILEHSADSPSSGYYGCHVVYYVGEDDPTWKFTARQNMHDEDMEAWLTALKESYTATQESGADLI